VDYLQEKFPIPADMCVINAGLSVREILFTLALSSQRPEQIIVVDAMDVGRTPGEVFELDLADIPEKKIDDFSMHQLPTSNLLRELKDLCGVDVTIISAQVEAIPDSVCPGLTPTLVGALPAACKMILERGTK
jgi:coenzyme F420 hydrogenase subunit delta